MKTKYIITFFSLFFVAFTIMAQSGSFVKAVTDKKRILIGEPLKLTIEWQRGKNDGQPFFSIDNIPHFEQLEKPVIDSVITSKGKTIREIYTVTSFDSGHWVIPSYSLSKTIKTDTIGIDVVFSDFDPGRDYHDIKDIIEVNPAKNKISWWWYAAGGVLLLGLVLLYLFRKEKPIVAIKQASVINPFEEAMMELEKLAREKPVAKQFHSSLTTIFRLYIFRKKGILSLQKTTDDLVGQLNGLNIDKEHFEKLSQSLRLSDFVKFAKYSPEEEDNKKCYNDILNAIKVIEQMDT